MRVVATIGTAGFREELFQKLGELEAARSPTGSTLLLQQCLKNLSSWYTFLSALKGGVYGISYCSKTRLRITVSLFVSIFEF